MFPRDTNDLLVRFTQAPRVAHMFYDPDDEGDYEVTVTLDVTSGVLGTKLAELMAVQFAVATTLCHPITTQCWPQAALDQWAIERGKGAAQLGGCVQRAFWECVCERSASHSVPARLKSDFEVFCVEVLKTTATATASFEDARRWAELTRTAVRVCDLYGRMVWVV